MAAAQAGDKVAYADLLSQSQRWLKRYLGQKIAPGQLDDLVQDILVSVHRKRATFDASRPFLPWLAAIARYRWVDHLRRGYQFAVETGLDDQLSSGAGHEDVVLAKISIDQLLKTLSPQQAQAISLVRVDGLTIAEAAERSGQSEAAVKVNIHRGLKKLAAMVDEAG